MWYKDDKLLWRLFGYETGGPDDEIWTQTSYLPFPVGEAGRALERAQKDWRDGKFPFRVDDVAGLWLKLFPNGNQVAALMSPDGSLLEWGVQETGRTRDSWPGEWRVDETTGYLQISVGDYGVQAIGSVDGLHSGVEKGPSGVSYVRLVRVVPGLDHAAAMERVRSMKKKP